MVLFHLRIYCHHDHTHRSASCSCDDHDTLASFSISSVPVVCGGPYFLPHPDQTATWVAKHQKLVFQGLVLDLLAFLSTPAAPPDETASSSESPAAAILVSSSFPHHDNIPSKLHLQFSFRAATAGAKRVHDFRSFSPFLLEKKKLPTLSLSIRRGPTHCPLAEKIRPSSLQFLWQRWRSADRIADGQPRPHQLPHFGTRPRPSLR
mmetsp:Transcript_3228/g.7594  ORF Transcript_3228/g.7594 Transcript_3228/m.7594 type:complete len:206 (-) Transcript_3228:3080-3697(-)